MRARAAHVKVFIFKKIPGGPNINIFDENWHEASFYILSIRLLDNPRGRHFTPKINDDCLPWLLDKSFFYDFAQLLYGQKFSENM